MKPAIKDHLMDTFDLICWANVIQINHQWIPWQLCKHQSGEIKKHKYSVQQNPVQMCLQITGTLMSYPINTWRWSDDLMGKGRRQLFKYFAKGKHYLRYWSWWDCIFFLSSCYCVTYLKSWISMLGPWQSVVGMLFQGLVSIQQGLRANKVAKSSSSTFPPWHPLKILFSFLHTSWNVLTSSKQFLFLKIPMYILP